MNLYIDFDGVVLDTITVTYRMIEEQHVDRNDFDAVTRFYKELNWDKMIRGTPQINDSINCIKKLMNNGYNCFILTHVTSLDEAVAKINYLVELIPDVTIIPVPKAVSKTKMIHTKGSILVDDFGGNLDEWASEGGIPVKFSLKTDKRYNYPSIDRLDKLMDLFPIKVTEDLTN